MDELIRSKRFWTIVAAVLAKIGLSRFGYEDVTSLQVVTLLAAFWLRDSILPIDLTKITDSVGNLKTMLDSNEFKFLVVGCAFVLVVPKIPVVLGESEGWPTAESIWPAVMAIALQINANAIRFVSMSMAAPNRVASVESKKEVKDA